MSNTSLIPSKEEIEILQLIAKSAAESNHFAKMGGLPGIFTLALYARELGVPIMTALYGGIQNIQGKITISAELMNNLIRQKGHTLQIKHSGEELCRIKGTRKDTNESHEEEFTMQDAVRAGLVKEGSGWKKYPSQMLFARCISKLAKRLFPDVISGSYVEGEIEDVKVKDEKTIDSKVIPISAPPEIEMKVEELKAEEETPKDKNPIVFISEAEAEMVDGLISPDDVSYRAKMLEYFAHHYGLSSCIDFTQVPKRALPGILKSIHARNAALLKKEEAANNE